MRPALPLLLLLVALAQASTTSSPSHATPSPPSTASEGASSLPSLDGDGSPVNPEDLFPQFTGVDAAMSVTLVFCILLSSVAGIGGGGLFIPVFLFISHYHLSIAHLLSHVMVLASASAQTIINLRTTDRDGGPVIKVGTCAVLTPVFLSGHAIGVTMFPLCPDTLVVFLLSGLLGVVSFQTGATFWRVYRKESSFAKKDTSLVERLSVHNDTIKESLLASPGDIECDQRPSSLADLTIDKTTTPKSSFQWTPIVILVLVWLVLLIVYLVMGSKAEPGVIPGVVVCGSTYWIALAAGILLSCFLSVFACRFLLKSAEGRQFGFGGIIRLCVASAFGGIFAGLVGIGGAQFVVPLLLAFGFNGVAASSTATLAVIVALSSDVVRAGIDRRMNPIPHLVLWVSAIAFCSALCGRSLSMFVARKFSRTSPIVFAQFVVLFLCCVLALISGISDLRAGKAFEFSTAKLC